MPGNQHVQSVTRALEILEVVNSSPRALSLAEIADQVGLKHTTTHNLVRTLAHRGYLAKETQPVRFRSGPAVADLIQGYCRDSLLERGAPALRRFTQRFPQASPILCQYLHGDIVVRLRMQPERPGVLERPLNAAMHPYGTACGILVQAFLPDEDRAAFRRRHPFWEHGAHLWQTADAFEEVLAAVRGRGVAAPWRGGEKPLLPAAAPVLRPNGELIAVFGASLPGDRIPAAEEEAFIEAVCATADRLSTQY